VAVDLNIADEKTAEAATDACMNIRNQTFIGPKSTEATYRRILNSNQAGKSIQAKGDSELYIINFFDDDACAGKPNKVVGMAKDVCVQISKFIWAKTTCVDSTKTCRYTEYKNKECSEAVGEPFEVTETRCTRTSQLRSLSGYGKLTKISLGANKVAPIEVSNKLGVRTLTYHRGSDCSAEFYAKEAILGATSCSDVEKTFASSKCADRLTSQDHSFEKDGTFISATCKSDIKATSVQDASDEITLDLPADKTFLRARRYQGLGCQPASLKSETAVRYPAIQAAAGPCIGALNPGRWQQNATGIIFQAHSNGKCDSQLYQEYTPKEFIGACIDNDTGDSYMLDIVNQKSTCTKVVINFQQPKY
jgi:hypothetical protein